MSEEMATKKREETQRGLQADVFEKPRSVTRLVAHFRALSWPPTFFQGMSKEGETPDVGRDGHKKTRRDTKRVTS